MTGAASATFLAPGTVIAERYEVGEELGRGGVAVVYAGRDRRLGTAVALKVLVPAPAVAHLVRARTRREITAVRALAHPNVISVFDLVEEGPWTVLVMEQVPGGDLQALVAGRGPLPPEQVAALGQGVAEALAAAHRRGIVHRDVKARNILIDGEGRPRLTDFGSARVDGQETLTETGGVIGTLDYAAPEVVAGRRGDARADIYALGITLHLALTGELPARSSPHLPPAPRADGHHPRALRPEIPGWLDAIVARATAAEPRRRFATCTGLAEALAARSLAPLPDPAVAGQLDFCVACGAPDPFGRTTCQRCAPAAARGDTWLMIDPPRTAAERQSLAGRLAALLHLAASDPAASEAAQGRRVLARLPQALATRAVRTLAERGVPARVIPAAADWRLLPPTLYLVAAAVAATGTLAGLGAWPWLLLSTPPMTGLILAVGYRGVGRPLFAATAPAERLPATLVAEIDETMAALPEADARILLADVVRLGRALCVRDDLSLSWADEVCALVRSACRAAGELGRVEEALAHLSAQRPRLSRVPESWALESGRLEAARDTFLQHLLDAISTLGVATAQAAQPDADAAAALARASHEIQDELRLRAEARAELDALLRPGPPS
jgi:hypothetical protein